MSRRNSRDKRWNRAYYWYLFYVILIFLGMVTVGVLMWEYDLIPKRGVGGS